MLLVAERFRKYVFDASAATGVVLAEYASLCHVFDCLSEQGFLTDLRRPENPDHHPGIVREGGPHEESRIPRGIANLVEKFLPDIGNGSLLIPEPLHFFAVQHAKLLQWGRGNSPPAELCTLRRGNRWG